MIPEDKINEILNNVKISDVIGQYIDIKPKGKDYIAICPFHSDSNPSLSISNEKHIFKCFACGEAGNAISFVRKYLNVSYPEAVKIVADIGGIPLDIQVSKEEQKRSRLININKQAAEFFEVMLNHTKQGEEGLAYLNKRGLNDETIKKFKIGLAPNDRNKLQKVLNEQGFLDLDLLELGLIGKNNNSYYDSFQNRIMFPLLDNYGNIVGFSGRIYNGEKLAKYVNSKETPLFHKSDILYNYFQAKNEIVKKDEVIVLEGFMDVIALDNIGISNTVASMGTALTEHHAREILKLTKNVILLFDGDDAGINAGIKAIPKFNGANVKLVTLPDNQDPDEFVRKYGKNKFLEYVDKNKMDILNFNYFILTRNVVKSDIMAVDSCKGEVFKLLRENRASNIVIDQILTRFSDEFKVSYEMLYNDFYNREYVNNNPKINNNIKNKPTRRIEVAPRNRYDIAECGLIKTSLYDKNLFLNIDKFMEGRYINFEAYQIRAELKKYFQINYIFNYEEFTKNLSPELLEFFNEKIYNQIFGDSKKYVEQLKKTFALKFLIDQRMKFEELKKSPLISDEEKQKINEKIILLSKEIRSQEKK